MGETVYNIESELFAEFCLDQMDETARTPARFKLEAQEFDGMVLGFGSSYATSNTHTGHMPGTTPPQGVRCSRISRAFRTLSSLRGTCA